LEAFDLGFIVVSSCANTGCCKTIAAAKEHMNNFKYMG